MFYFTYIHFYVLYPCSNILCKPICTHVTPRQFATSKSNSQKVLKTPLTFLFRNLQIVKLTTYYVPFPKFLLPLRKTALFANHLWQLKAGVYDQNHITKQCYLTTRYGGQISQFKSSCNFWPIFVSLWTTHFCLFLWLPPLA